MSNKKKLTVILCVLAVVCVFAVLAFSGVIKLPKGGGNESSTGNGDAVNDGIEQDDYKSAAAATGTSKTPYLSTLIEDLFYSMDTEGNVSFYKLDESGVFNPVPASGTYDVSVIMSESDISATVTYYKDGDSIEGYGLYRGTDGEYNLYPYAFFRLTNYPKGYSDASSGGCLLLVDTTEDDFYSDDKVYEEPFAFTYSDSSSTRLLSEANRTVGLDGTKRADYSMLNDDIINAWDSRILFFSGRHYSEEDERVDLMKDGGSGNNVDNILLVSDVMGYTVRNDGGVKYVTVDDDSNVCVRLYSADSEESETLETFDGVTRDDVVVNDGFVYDSKNNELYSLSDEKAVSISYDNISGFKADTLAANGDTIILRGYINSVSPAVLIVSASDGSVNGSFVNSDFTNLVNPVVLSDGRAMFTVKSGESFDYYIVAK